VAGAYSQSIKDILEVFVFADKYHLLIAKDSITQPYYM